MEQSIKRNPKITLMQMKQLLQNEHKIHEIIECIRQHLDGLLYTLKDSLKEPEKSKIVMLIK